jgi:hypothetical protein
MCPALGLYRAHTPLRCAERQCTAALAESSRVLLCKHTSLQDRKASRRLSGALLGAPASAGRLNRGLRKASQLGGACNSAQHWVGQSRRCRAAAAGIVPLDTGTHLGSTRSAPASTLPLRSLVPALGFAGTLERRPGSTGQAWARRSCPKCCHVGAAMTAPPQAARPNHLTLSAERRCTGRTVQQACRCVSVLVGH